MREVIAGHMNNNKKVYWKKEKGQTQVSRSIIILQGQARKRLKCFILNVGGGFLIQMVKTKIKPTSPSWLTTRVAETAHWAEERRLEIHKNTETLRQFP